MSPKRFFYILCGIVACLVLVGGGGYYFASKMLHERTSALSKKMAEDQAAEQKLSQLGDLQKQYKRLGPILPAIEEALPANKEQSKIALQLRNIAAQSGMNFAGVTFPASTAPGPTSQTVPVGAVLAIPVTFQLQGSYDQLQSFLKQQENLSRYTSVTSLAITADPKNPNKLSFDVSLNVYMKP